VIDLPNRSDMLVAVDLETSGLHPDDGARQKRAEVARRHNEEAARAAMQYPKRIALVTPPT
jgi:hypothetical protein